MAARLFKVPTITFEFKDEGQTSNEQGPYHYDWTAMVLTTQCEDPETACDAYVTGTATSPGTVTVYLNDTAAQVAAGQQQIGELTTEHWGTLTFELCVEERETGDYYYYRMPYVLTIPETVPGTAYPGHKMYLGSTPGGQPCVVADYYLADSEDASWFQVDCLSPDLTVMGTSNPGTEALHHYYHLVVSPVTVFKAEPYITVFRGVDSHGDDGDPRAHRERENKRMLPVNDREPPKIQSVTMSTYADNTPLDANPGNGQTGSAIGLRIFPCFTSENDAAGADRRKVTVTVQLALGLDQAKAGWPVTLKAFDVDDPSASEQPIDTEQEWPTENADNRDQTYPNGQFEGGGAQIERTTDADGEVTVVFLTGMQPGDNYRIAAGMGTLAQMPPLKARANDVEEGTQRSRVHYFRDDEGMPIGWYPLPEAGPSAVVQSPVLTVWRKLFVEVDSMGNPRIEGTSEFLTDDRLGDEQKTWDPDQFTRFDHEHDRWSLCPNLQTPAQTFTVSSSNGLTVQCATPGQKLTDVAEEGDTYAVDFAFDPSPPTDDPRPDPPDIADPSPAVLGPILLPCYIVVEQLGPEYCEPDQAWHLDMFTLNYSYPPGEQGVVIPYWLGWYVYAVYDAKWFTSVPASAYWCVGLLGAYDNVIGLDNDEDGEGGSPGGTSKLPGKVGISAVYYETLRDLAHTFSWNETERQHALAVTTAHELLHQMYLNHNYQMPGGNPPLPLSIMFAPRSLGEVGEIGRGMPLCLTPAEWADVRSVREPQCPEQPN